MHLQTPNSVISLVCLLFSILVSAPTYATKKTPQKKYLIEIIAFARNMAENVDSEIWQENPGFPKIHHTIELYSPVEYLLEDYPENIPKHFIRVELDDDNKQAFTKYARKMQASPDYQLLFHYAWSQTLTPKAVLVIDTPNTDPILFDEKAETSAETPIIPSPVEQSPEEQLLAALLEEEKDFSQPLKQLPFFISELDQIEPLDEMRHAPQSKYTATSYEGPPQHKIYGNFTLSKGRYLHMNLDFLYRGEPYFATAAPASKDKKNEEELPLAQTIRQDNATSHEMNENLTQESATVIAEDPPLPGFRISSSKRVRLNQVYYFDHPLFGMLVQVTRYVPKAATGK